jgi:hypothetical protein
LKKYNRSIATSKAEQQQHDQDSTKCHEHCEIEFFAINIFHFTGDAGL